MSVNNTKLAKLLAMLSSSYDGEVVAAARAVVTLLRANDLRPDQLRVEEAGLSTLAVDAKRCIDKLEAALSRANREIDWLRAENDALRDQLVDGPDPHPPLRGHGEMPGWVAMLDGHS